MQATVEPPRMKAMPLSSLREPFDDLDWLYEIKFDGFRGFAYVFGGRCQLVSRKGHVYSAPIFNRLGTAIAAGIKAKNAVLDGEICALGSDGRSIFNDLLFRRTKWAYFYAFDLLWLNGKDYRLKPLFERKAKLRWLISPNLSPLLYLDHIEAEGKRLFSEVCKHDMEGIVAKWKDGLYVPDGRKSTWLKIKNPEYSQLKGRHGLFKKRSSET